MRIYTEYVFKQIVIPEHTHRVKKATSKYAVERVKDASKLCVYYANVKTYVTKHVNSQ